MWASAMNFIPQLHRLEVASSAHAHAHTHLCWIDRVYVTGSEKTDHFVMIQFVQYGPKALPRSQSTNLVLSMPRCSTASWLALTQVLAFSSAFSGPYRRSSRDAKCSFAIIVSVKIYGARVLEPIPYMTSYG